MGATFLNPRPLEERSGTGAVVLVFATKIKIRYLTCNKLSRIGREISWAWLPDLVGYEIH